MCRTDMLILREPLLLGIVPYCSFLSQCDLHITSEHNCGASNTIFKGTNTSHLLTGYKIYDVMRIESAELPGKKRHSVHVPAIDKG